MRASTIYVNVVVIMATFACTHASKSSLKLEMPAHTFKAPLNYGASISLDNGVQIVPSVPNRMGYFFHKHRIESDHFITSLELNFTPAGTSGSVSDQRMGVWFTASNVSEGFYKSVKGIKIDDWREALSSGGFGLNGIVPSSFQGVGVVFSFPSTISLVWSDGKKQIDLAQKSDGGFNFRKEGVKMTFSVSRKNGKVSCFAYDASKGKALLEATLSSSEIPSAGFLGITAYSGSQGKPDRILLREMRSLNLDTKAGTGEDEPVSSKLEERLEKRNLHLKDLVHDDDEDALSDPMHQIQDVNKAISILSEYLDDTRYRDTALSRTLAEVQSRAETLEDSINDLRMEIKFSFKSQGGGGVVKLADEIKGLTDLIQLHSEETKSFEGLKNRLKEINEAPDSGHHNPQMLDKVLKSNSELESEVANANFTANAVIALFGLVVLVIGFVLYRNMRQYEKKHFL